MTYEQDVERMLAELTARMERLERVVEDPYPEEVTTTAVEEPPGREYIDLVAHLYGQLDEGAVGPPTFFRALRATVLRAGSLVGPGSVFERVLDGAAAACTYLAELTADAPRADFRSWVGDVGRALEQEYAEPEPYAGVTFAELVDAVAWSIRANYGAIVRTYGKQVGLLVSGISSGLGRWAMFLGESLGPGEKTLRGAIGNYEGPWSIGG